MQADLCAIIDAVVSVDSHICTGSRESQLQRHRQNSYHIHQGIHPAVMTIHTYAIHHSARMSHPIVCIQSPYTTIILARSSTHPKAVEEVSHSFYDCAYSVLWAALTYHNYTEV